MTDNEVLELVKAHTRYDCKCECGEYLLKRGYGWMSERNAWEKHFSEVLIERLGRNA